MKPLRPKTNRYDGLPKMSLIAGRLFDYRTSWSHWNILNLVLIVLGISPKQYSGQVVMDLFA